MVQQYKEDEVNKLIENFKGAQHMIFTEYKGLTVEKITALRKKLYNANSELRVVKNRLAKLAYKKLNLDFKDEWFKGPVALVLCKDNDFVKSVNIVNSFAKDEEKLIIKLAYLEKKVFELEDVKIIANLPSREQLIAKLLGLLNSPITSLVFTLKNIVSKPVMVLKAISDKKQENS